MINHIIAIITPFFWVELATVFVVVPLKRSFRRGTPWVRCDVGVSPADSDFSRSGTFMKFMDKRAKHLNLANGFDLLLLGFTGFASLQGEQLKPDETWLHSYTCLGVLFVTFSHTQLFHGITQSQEKGWSSGCGGSTAVWLRRCGSGPKGSKRDVPWSKV